MSEQEADAGQAEEGQTQEFDDDSSPEEIEEAKALGWKDPAEWKGAPPPKGFMKAKDYLERGKTVLPIVRAENAKLQLELASARKELSDFKKEQAKVYERLSKMSASALQRQREQLESKYEKAIEAAAEVGDKAEVKRLRAEEKKAVKEFDEAVEDKPELDDDKKSGKATGNSPDENAEIDAWVKDNEWFNDDEDMRVIAINYHGKLKRDQPNLSLKDNLAKVRAYVAKKFPGEFKKDEPEDDGDDEAPKRRGSPVESGGRIPGGGVPKTAWSKLPDEAKKQADKFIKEDGLFLEKGETVEKDIQKARERYALEFLGEKQ